MLDKQAYYEVCRGPKLAELPRKVAASNTLRLWFRPKYQNLLTDASN